MKMCVRNARCQKLQKPFPRSRISSVRASRFGDVVFMDHATIAFGDQKVLVILVLNGGSGLLWAAVQDQGTEPQTRDK
eukprot:2064055-Amphidinium_carterae.1